MPNVMQRCLEACANLNSLGAGNYNLASHMIISAVCVQILGVHPGVDTHIPLAASLSNILIPVSLSKSYSVSISQHHCPATVSAKTTSCMFMVSH